MFQRDLHIPINTTIKSYSKYYTKTDTVAFQRMRSPIPLFHFNIVCNSQFRIMLRQIFQSSVAEDGPFSTT